MSREKLKIVFSLNIIIVVEKFLYYLKTVLKNLFQKIKKRKEGVIYDIIRRNEKYYN